MIKFMSMSGITNYSGSARSWGWPCMRPPSMTHVQRSKLCHGPMWMPQLLVRNNPVYYLQTRICAILVYAGIRRENCTGTNSKSAHDFTDWPTSRDIMDRSLSSGPRYTRSWDKPQNWSPAPPLPRGDTFWPPTSTWTTCWPVPVLTL